MEVLIEQVLVYGTVGAVCVLVVWLYLRGKAKASQETERKVAVAKEEGLFEPVSLHPYIDLNTCIGSAACVADCPEKDILGISNGKATVINTSNCIGHGACFHACPVEAISLRIGTETRGVDLPHVSEHFETNIRGIYIAGELGGMGLIKNSVEQGQQALESIVRQRKSPVPGVVDVVIVGAGPAGISATLAAKQHGLKSVTLEQNSLGGTVYTFPRSKLVMTAPMDLPLYGKVKLFETSKDELLTLWKDVIDKHQLVIEENTKVEHIVPQADGTFRVETNTGQQIMAHHVLLAIGRRGSPRKLGVPGEESQKVAYRLLEPELIAGKKILVVGGGDSAIESALLLQDQNEVTLSYRSDKFARLKPKNRDLILQAENLGKLRVLYSSELLAIDEHMVTLKTQDHPSGKMMANDLVYIFAGGELPTTFLTQAGVKITKRFGHIMKKHK